MISHQMERFMIERTLTSKIIALAEKFQVVVGADYALDAEIPGDGAVACPLKRAVYARHVFLAESPCARPG